MARGGYRPGSGRKPGSKNSKEYVFPKQSFRGVPNDIAVAAERSGMSPLDYMLTVMNDDGADAARRDRMAVAAAPFCHARADTAAPGKKETAQKAADTAGDGTEWASDLAPEQFN